jgi:hypothetical protein
MLAAPLLRADLQWQQHSRVSIRVEIGGGRDELDPQPKSLALFRGTIADQLIAMRNSPF